jgi:DNA-directed RNA polymerase subunit RPC12/RpoP
MKKYRCMNIGNCKIAGTKETFEIAEGEELVCPKCGSSMVVEVSSKKPLPLIIGGVAVLCVLGGAGYAIFGGGAGGDEECIADTVSVETVIADTVTTDTVTVDTAEVEPAVQTKADVKAAETTGTSKSSGNSVGNGKLRLSYGTYTGAVRNGYPHGQGRLTYTTTRQINRNDIKGRTANAGDYVIGEFFNGFVVYGKHYDSAGNLLGSLNFGVGSEDSYESK